MKKQFLLSGVLNILKHFEIPYAIVGRTEDYPENIGSDVDIMIHKEDLGKFHKAIWDIEKTGAKVVQMFQHEIVAFYYIVFAFNGTERICIQPDVCTDYYRKGRKLLSANEMLSSIREAPQGGFFVLSPEKEFIYYLLKKIDKQKISEEQFEHIRNSFLFSPEKSLDEARLIWCEENLSIIKDSFENNKYEYLNSCLKQLQNGIHSSKKMGFVDRLKNIILKVKRVLHPTGYVIAVMGPDGCGKTTVINQLKKDIEPAFRRIQQFHLFPVPQKGESKAENNPQGKTKRNFVLSVLKLMYFVRIYVGGHFKYVLPAKIRSTFTIFDRYYDDILVDPLRYRNGTPDWVVKFFGLFIPEPELWIILDCPTEVIQARKSEVPPEETERQRQAYLALAKTKKNCIVLNTNRNVAEISVEACKFICESLNKRAIKRYKK